ncbi:MAG: exo-alpha-sialidase [Verrucomicrobia bacterium]|nr:exo-alpha-sialidase [Verrucomicrobiota bacterium]
MKILQRGLVYDVTTVPDPRRAASFTSLRVLASGTILALFQLGSAKHSLDATLALCRTRDRARTWERIPVEFSSVVDGIPGSLAAGEIVEVRPGRLLLMATWFDRSDRSESVFDAATEALRPSKQLISFSSDEGQSWTGWRELPIRGLHGCAITGPILQWADGSIAFAFESYRDITATDPSIHHAAWLMPSNDGGESFGKPVLVAQDPAHGVYYWDQRLCTGPELGEYIALFWSHDLTSKQDLAVHIARNSVRAPADSMPQPRATRITGQITTPLLLPDGRLLALTVHRQDPACLRLFCSPDRGDTWPSELVVYEHNEKAVLTQGSTGVDYRLYWADMFRWSFGHPAMVQLNEQDVLIAYYAGAPNCMSIHWAILDTRAG